MSVSGRTGLVTRSFTKGLRGAEDEDSLASLLSQTLRALPWGTLPAANGRAILAGCRIMQGLLTHRLAKAKFHVNLRRLAVTHPDMMEVEEELFDREPPIEPESEPEPVTCNSSPVICNPSPVTSNQSPVTSNSSPVTPSFSQRQKGMGPEPAS
jgi:hypothetical protein